MIPQQTVSKATVMKLNSSEQQTLERARQKMKQIQENHTHSSGLTAGEIKVAIKVGLIEPEEAWWYTEEWQKGERQASKDFAEEHLSRPLGSSELSDELDKL